MLQIWKNSWKIVLQWKNLVKNVEKQNIFKNVGDKKFSEVIE